MSERRREVALWAIVVFLIAHLLAYVVQNRYWYASDAQKRIDRWTGVVSVLTQVDANTSRVRWHWRPLGN